MKKSPFAAIFAVAVMSVTLLTGCTSVNTSDGATLLPIPDSTHPGYEAQYALRQSRVSGEATIHVLLGLFAWGANGFADNSSLSIFSFLPSPANFAKSAAVYSACKNNQADTLVGTRYTVTTTDYLIYKSVSCRVAGFPATMTGTKLKKPYVLPGKNPQVFWSAETPVVLK